MGWKQGVFNVLCNLISVVILNIYSGYQAGINPSFWQRFFDFKLNYAIFFMVINFIFVLYATNSQKKKFAEQLHTAKFSAGVTKDIADSLRDNQCSYWGYGNHIKCAVVQIHDRWQDWITQLIKVTERPELEQHNFGDHYCIYDLGSSEVIEFPKDKHTRESKIGNRFHTGKILRIMPKNV